ncbi:hypothetical protein [Rummeliibacillus sp. TYF-LIM-RU47]|uniref:hypothetical protein n=1 Tax=Rummeliibacillus sp. TYF-LIM-RU47 TaxID=2608406 RepID=UPI00123A0FE3|nr:hypothetical protein [Rummeliibacillus sp. TYF-LIM-RU47]
MKKLQFCLFKVLSWSPFLRVTDDSKYNKIGKESMKFRFSIFSLTLGVVSVYILTWNTERKFKWFHKLNLYDVQRYKENIEEFETLYDDYLHELQEKKPTNKIIEKEFLSKRIVETETQKAKTFNKFLTYITLFVFIVPLYAPKLTKLTPYLDTYKTVYVLIMGCVILNLALLTYEIVKVKNSKRVKFNDIRQASKEQVENKLIAMLFYEWKHLNNESILEIALVKNMEKYMSIMILLSIIIIISSNIEDGVKASIEKAPIVQEKALVFTFQNVEEDNFHTLLLENNKKIDMVKNHVLSGKFNQVIVISDSDEKMSDDLVKIISLYKDQNMRIIKVRKKNYPEHIEVILTKE